MSAESRAWEQGARLALSKAGATLMLYAEVLALNPHASSADGGPCDVCGQVKPPFEFVQRPWAPGLHSKTCVACKEAEAQERTARRIEKEEVRRQERCPTPRKRVHTSKADALEHIRSLYKAARGNPDYAPYLCECGVWHVGHNKARLRDRARESLRRSR